VKRAITLGENFLESSVPCYDQIIKSRVKTFFDELTPLLMIDNAYRGIHDANDYTTKMWSETATDSADTTAKINSFLSELAILISEDNIYRGYHKTAEEVQAS
jgi:hypothetical protein